MAQPVDTTPAKPSPKRNLGLLNIVINILIPSLILMRFSGEDQLGPVNGLLLALAFPIGYGLYDFIARRHFNVFSVLGLISVLLTGGIGILQLDVRWLAVKEAGIPLILGLIVIGSLFTPYPLVGKLLTQVVNQERVQRALEEKGTTAAYEKRVRGATYLVAGSFFLSAFLNFLLVRLIVVSPPGSTAFNEELGRMTALSLPVIAVPSLIVMTIALLYLFSGIKKLTGLEFEEIVASP